MTDISKASRRLLSKVNTSTNLRVAAIKAAVILVPCYGVAWLTDKLVYVVPTLAASAFFANALDASTLTRRRVDDDEGGPDDSDSLLEPAVETDSYQDTLPESGHGG